MRKKVLVTLSGLLEERKLLVAARVLIETQSEEFVCLALDQARVKTDLWSTAAWAAKNRLVNWIEHQIDPHFSYDQWVEAQFQTEIPDWAYPSRNKGPHPQAVDARLRWIDWMIEQIDDDIKEVPK